MQSDEEDEEPEYGMEDKEMTDESEEEISEVDGYAISKPRKFTARGTLEQYYKAR